MSSLKKIIAKKAQRRRKLEYSLANISQQLITMGALKIILFGSLAYGTEDVNSDIDILVVMPVNRSGKEWQKYIYENIERNTAADIFVYNENEFKNYRESTFLQNALNSGRIIYEKA